MDFSMFYSVPISVISVLMFLFLAIGAQYDRHGSFVPDGATVPYAVLGLCAAAFSGRWISLILGMLLLIMVLFIKKPKWLSKLEQKLLLRSYKTEEEIEAINAEQIEQADGFEQKYGKKYEKLLIVLQYLSFGFFLVSFIVNVFQNKSVSEQTPVFVSIALFLDFIGYFHISNRRNKQEESTEEGITAFGGADAIILIGMLGFYGVIGFMFVVAATFLLYLIYHYVIRVLICKKHENGQPMLPAFLLTIPVRVLVYCGLIYGMISSYEWFFRTLFE